MTYELELLDVGALPLAPGARVRVAPHLTPAVAVVGHRRRRRRRRRRLARERCEATSGEGRPSLLRSRRGRGLGQDWRPRAGPTRQRQLNQKIMRVCISYTHLYPNKSLNHTSSSRKYVFELICRLQTHLGPI